MSLNATRLHLLTERLSSLFRASLRQVASEHGLKLPQLEALVYLSLANRYSDTPLALAEYLGLTKGTVSQTVKALERQGLITKSRDEADGRVQRCAVTEAGMAVVREAYPADVFEDEPSPKLANDLERLLRQIQRRNGFRTFGVCRSCRFFEPRARGGRCGLTQEPLSISDTSRICREHEVPEGRDRR